MTFLLTVFTIKLCYQNVTFFNSFDMHKTFNLSTIFYLSEFFKNLGSELFITFLIRKMIIKIINLITTFWGCLNRRKCCIVITTFSISKTLEKCKIFARNFTCKRFTSLNHFFFQEK